MELTISTNNNIAIFNRKEPENKIRFVDFARAYVMQCAWNTKSWINAQECMCRKIEEFENFYNSTLYTHNASANCLKQFVDFMENQNLKPGYIASIIGKVKTMLRVASEYGCIVDPSYRQVTVKADIPQTIALTIGEIALIYKCDKLTRLQEEIKDIFIFGCVVGQRYSDYSIMSMKDYSGNDTFQIKQKKTGTIVNTPAGQIAHEILNKYNGSLPEARSIQQFNRQIKLICKKAGIDQEIKISETKGKNFLTKKVAKWQLVSSHTARRTFATIMSQSNKVPLEELQLLLGHSNINTTMRYIKRDSKSIARSASNINVLNYL